MRTVRVWVSDGTSGLGRLLRTLATPRRGGARRSGRLRRPGRGSPPRTPTPGRGAGESATGGLIAALSTADGGPPPRPRLVGDGLRRVGEQPGAADRGRRAAPRRRVRVRPPTRRRSSSSSTSGGCAAPGRTVTVLRPVIAMAADGTRPGSPRARRGHGSALRRGRPAAQFLHLDDLAVRGGAGRRATSSTACSTSPPTVGSPASGCAPCRARPAVKLPGPARRGRRPLRWRFQRGPIPPGLRSYTRSPWLVANDRLQAEGWRPTVTNEQAYVEGTEAKWWTMVTPKRRQEIAARARGADRRRACRRDRAGRRRRPPPPLTHVVRGSRRWPGSTRGLGATATPPSASSAIRRRGARRSSSSRRGDVRRSRREVVARRHDRAVNSDDRVTGDPGLRRRTVRST